MYMNYIDYDCRSVQRQSSLLNDFYTKPKQSVQRTLYKNIRMYIAKYK